MSAATVVRKVSAVWQDKRGRLNDGEAEWVFSITAGNTGAIKRGGLAWSREEAEEARGELLARMDAAGWAVTLA